MMGYLNGMVRALRAASGWCLGGMVLITCADVIGSQFNHPVFGSEEVVGLLGSVLLAFSLPVAQRDDAHIGVDLLYERLGQRARLVIDLVVKLVSAVFFYLVTWQSMGYAAEMRRVGQVSPTIQLPLHYVIYCMALGCFLLALVLTAEFFGLLAGERRHD